MRGCGGGINPLGYQRSQRRDTRRHHTRQTLRGRCGSRGWGVAEGAKKVDGATEDGKMEVLTQGAPEVPSVGASAVANFYVQSVAETVPDDIASFPRSRFVSLTQVGASARTISNSNRRPIATTFSAAVTRTVANTF